MRRSVGLGLALALATVASCSEIPTAPRVSVTVSGRITDRDGPPLAGITVSFQMETTGSGYPSYFYAMTDADGRYTLKVSEGVYRFGLSPGYRGLPYVNLRGVKVGPSGATIDYRYTGVRVSGSIVGPNGQFLTSALVGAFGLIGTDYVFANSLSLAGHYSLLLPAGVYDFNASSGGDQDGLPRITSHNVPIESDTTIDFALAGFTVTATFTLSGATPMIGAHVFAEGDGASAGARTGLDGVATIFLPAGDYSIAASPFPENVVGPQRLTKSIQADDALAFDFSGPEWSMTIRRASDSTPITGAWARLGDGSSFASTTTDGFGRCTFLVRPGTGYDLSVDWLEGGSYRSATVSNLFSAADTTFDISVSAPVFP